MSAAFERACDRLMQQLHPTPDCDCPLDPYHRWNCDLTPVWAQTIRDLDCNPWTVVENAARPITFWAETHLQGKEGQR